MQPSSQLAAFLLGSLLLGWISRHSLSHPSSHGFTRFLAWEAILALTLLNLPYWFTDPFSPAHLLSWLLLLASLVLVIEGVLRLRLAQHTPAVRQDPALLKLEQTTELVEDGVYHLIRHPLYSSLLCLTWGIFFKHTGWIDVVLSGAASICLYLTAKREETENLAFFGSAYARYMQRTKRFIPFIW